MSDYDPDTGRCSDCVSGEEPCPDCEKEEHEVQATCRCEKCTCPKCGYNNADQHCFGDHHLCEGAIPPLAGEPTP